MRDQIAADLQALRQSLSGVEVAAGQVSSMIPTAGQMILGFVLPFALTFVAIPLESFIHSSRTVIGLTLGFLLRTGAFTLRLIGNIINHLGKAVVALYDLAIFPAIWVEEKMKKTPAVEQPETPHKEVHP